MTESGTPWKDTFARFSGTLRDAFRAWGRGEGCWSDGRVDFEDAALRAFRLQYRGNPVYRSYCDARDATPDTVGSWTGVPAVPTAAFRSVELITGPGDEPPLRFRTSGTTRGTENRGLHPVPDPDLYRASLEAAFRRFVLERPGLSSLERARFCSLVPRFSESDDSSLSWMTDALLDRFGTEESVVVAGREGLDLEAAGDAARAAREDGEPLCVLTTTLALDEWTRSLAEAGESVDLPEGSRVMDTGGAKGREGLERGDVLAATRRWLGVDPVRVVNEFGMTELASQRYARPRGAGAEGDPGEGDPDAPVLVGPPWLRTRVLDPVTLEPRGEGEVGILCHFDLANLGSVCAVLTEDRGRAVGDGIQWAGRTPGSPPRGCSLATAELLRGA